MARTLIETNLYYDDEKNLYYVYMDYGKDESGRRIRKQKTFKRKADAKKHLKEFEANKTKGTLVKPKVITLEEWLTYWLTSIVANNSEESTVYGYKNIINKHIVPRLGHIQLQKLKPTDIQDYYNEKTNDKKASLSSNTLRKHHALLKTSLSIAVMQDVLLSNPVDKVIPPKQIKPKIQFYDVNTMKRLFELVKGTRLECAVWVSGFTGIRRSELCGLKWSAIDFEGKIMSIEHTRVNVGSKVIDKDRTKNHSSTRKIAISDVLIEVLQKEKERQEENRDLLGEHYIESDYVIVMDDGKPYRPNYLSELFTKYINDSGLPKLTLHGLRHSLVSCANDAGISLYNISRVMGHSSTSTTSKVYTHLFDDAQKESMNVIGKLYSK